MLFNNRINAFFTVFLALAPVSCGEDSDPTCRNLPNGRCWQCYGDQCGEMASSRCGPDGICDYVPPGSTDDRNRTVHGCGDGFCNRDADEDLDNYCPEDCPADDDSPREGEGEEGEAEEGEGEEGEPEEGEGEEECPPCEPCFWAGGDPYTNCINSCKFGCHGPADICDNWRACFDDCEYWAYDGDPRCTGGPCCAGRSCDDCQCCANGNCGYCYR